MTEQIYSIPSHQDPKILIRWLALIGGIVLLISMLSVWVGICLTVLMGFALYNETQGRTSWLWHWIPKQPVKLKATWPTEQPSKITLHLSGHYHGWISYGWTIWIVVTLGVVAVSFGLTTAAFVPLLLLSSVWVTVAERVIESSAQDSSDSLNINLPPSASWYELHTYLRHHQDALADEGVLFLPSMQGDRPLILPSELNEWSIQSSNESS